jgi:hypothetical protein
MKSLWLIVAVTAGLLALRAATPAITRLISALTPLVLVVGVLALAWQMIGYFTRR